MEINNGQTERDDKQEIEIVQKDKIFLTITNAITSILILLIMACIEMQRIGNYIQGSIIILQSFLLGYMLMVQYKRKQKGKVQFFHDSLAKPKTINIFYKLHNKMIKTQNFEYIFLSLIASIYISIFEIIMSNYNLTQETIILSLFLSLFINMQSQDLNKANLSLGFSLILQIYTLIRLQLYFLLRPAILLLNIIFLIFQISNQKTFFTKKMKKQINIRTEKSKTEHTMRLYQSILSIIPEGLAVVNSDKKLLYANPTLKKILQSHQKNDILQILMNLGKNNNDQINQNQSKNPSLKIPIQPTEKNNFQSQIDNYESHKQKEKEDSRQNSDNGDDKELQCSNNLIKPETNSQYFQEVVHVQPTCQINKQIGYLKNNQSNFIAQCSIDNQKNNDFDSSSFDDNSKLQFINKHSLTSINQIFQNKNDLIEKQTDYLKYYQNQGEENKYSHNNIFLNNKSQQINNSSNSNQTRSSHSLISGMGKNMQQKIRDQRIEFPSKARLTGYNRESASQNNFQYYGTDNSEILSYQGFGFPLGEEESQNYQIPITPIIQIRKRKSENYSIKPSIDNNSALSFSSKQQNQRASLKRNSYSGVSGYPNYMNRSYQKKSSQFQQPLEELVECQQVSQESERKGVAVNPSECVSCLSQNYLSAVNQNHNKMHQESIHNQASIKIKGPSQNLSMKCISVHPCQLNHRHPKNISGSNIENYTNKKDNQVNKKGTFRLKTRKLEEMTKISIDSQIVMKKTDVADILNSIFQEKDIYGENQDPNKNDQNKQINKNSMDINNQSKFDKNIDNVPQNEDNQQKQSQDQDENQNNHPSRDLNKKKSFISHLKNEEKDLPYLQKQDNIIKIQVKFKNKDLVLQFITVDALTENQKKDPLVLIMVQDMWQDLYQKKVQDLQKDKMRIFASLSHELRTPLNCSISMLEVLRDEISKTNPSYIEEYLNPALFSNKLLLNQINDILDFVQMDSGKFKYSFYDFNILNLLKDCSKLVSMQAQMKELDIRISIDTDTPDIIRSDPNRIRQIILNFLSNSLKFTKKGYIEIGINKIQHDIYKLYVKDTGIGISQENLNTIFSFCAKVKYEKRDEGLNAQGCGLGLTISDSIAKGLLNCSNQEGGIRVESVYGEGSVFSIIFQDMNTNKDDGMKDFKQQLSKSISIGKRYTRHMTQKDDDLQLNRIVNNSSDAPYKGRSQFILSPTKSIVKNRKLSNLINPQQIIFEDDNSCIDSQNASADPIKYNQNSKKSTFVSQYGREKDEKESSYYSSRYKHQIQIQENKKQDSAMIIEDDNENIKGIFCQPHLLIQHHFYRFQEDEQTCFSAGLRSRMNSPGGTNRSQQRLNQSECLSQQSGDQKVKSQAKIDSNNTHPISNNDLSYKQTENSINLAVINNSQNTTFKKHKSINSFKTQVTEYEKQRSIYQEQEGFTSYNGYNKVMEPFINSSRIIITSFTGLEKSPQIKSQAYYPSQTLLAIEYNLQDEKMQQGKDTDNFNSLNPQEIMNEIIKRNNNKKLKCKCPQIFIVDDNQFNLYALSKTIQQFSFSCQQISDSIQTVEDLKTMYFNNCCIAPKIIFMDIEMPVKNGYQVAEEINQFYKNIQLQDTPVIIACTAYVGQEDRDKAINAGMDDFINKPILKTAFQQLILNWADLFL